MSKQNYTAEQKVVKLREIEIMVSRGPTIAESVRQAGISEQTYYLWRNKYNGMNITDAKRMKDLEKETAG